MFQNIVGNDDIEGIPRPRELFYIADTAFVKKRVFGHSRIEIHTTGEAYMIFKIHMRDDPRARPEI